MILKGYLYTIKKNIHTKHTLHTKPYNLRKEVAVIIDLVSTHDILKKLVATMTIGARGRNPRRGPRVVLLYLVLMIMIFPRS